MIRGRLHGRAGAGSRRRSSGGGSSGLRGGHGCGGSSKGWGLCGGGGPLRGDLDGLGAGGGFGGLALLAGDLGLTPGQFGLGGNARDLGALTRLLLGFLAGHFVRSAAAFFLLAVAARLFFLGDLGHLLAAHVEIREHVLGDFLVQAAGSGQLFGNLIALRGERLAESLHLVDDVLLFGAKKLCDLLNLHNNSDSGCCG